MAEDQKIKIEPYYRKQAKHIVDTLFDKEFLNKDCSRNDMDSIEEFLGYMIQIHSEMAVKAALLIKKGKEVKENSG